MRPGTEADCDQVEFLLGVGYFVEFHHLASTAFGRILLGEFFNDERSLLSIHLKELGFKENLSGSTDFCIRLAQSGYCVQSPNGKASAPMKKQDIERTEAGRWIWMDYVASLLQPSPENLQRELPAELDGERIIFKLSSHLERRLQVSFPSYS